jgi:2-isopropylmalate synthase
VHCHDDLGMAVANSLTAVVAGARQIECTINGIGERAGNCALEEVVMALKTREAFFKCRTNVNTTRLYPTSRLVASITGASVPRNKAIVGENAFAHESGIHQHGMLKNAQTYEIMRPEDVGLSRSNLVLGKHSGRHALRERVQKLGFQIDEVEFERVFTEFKALADRKKELFDGDIEALVLNAEGHAGGPWSLVALQSAARSGETSTAEVTLRHTDGHAVTMAGQGDGPVDAAYKAVESATGVALHVTKYEVRALTVGEDAQGETIVYGNHGDRSYRGASVSTNIVEASVNALLEVINRIELAQRAARTAAAGERRDSDRLAQTAV